MDQKVSGLKTQSCSQLRSGSIDCLICELQRQCGTAGHGLLWENAVGMRSEKENPCCTKLLHSFLQRDNVRSRSATGPMISCML